MKPGETMACCSCEQGHYEEVFDRYEATAADDVKIVIPRVKLLRCATCGDELLPPETQQQIDAAVAEQTEQLTPRELEAIWERFNLDQTETGEALGLGGKTFHRWLKGTQYPSRSMGYYLRVLAEFPQAFEWLKERGWRKHNRLAQTPRIQFELQFPDLSRSRSEPEFKWPEAPATGGESWQRFNPAMLFQKTKV